MGHRVSKHRRVLKRLNSHEINNTCLLLEQLINVSNHIYKYVDGTDSFYTYTQIEYINKTEQIANVNSNNNELLHDNNSLF